MNLNYLITQKEVDIYQKLYYQHYKPLSLNYSDEKSIKERMVNVLKSVDWTWKKFMDYKSIDLFQRLVFEYSHSISNLSPMISYPEYRIYDPNYGALRLKDNRFSEDKDILN